jgi:hypothetical protein
MHGPQRAPSAATTCYRDRRLAAAIIAIRGFSPSETVIVAEDWLPVSYYLPSYSLIPFRAPSETANLSNPPSPEQQALVQESAALLWFESTLDHYNTSPAQTETQSMAVGTLRLLRPQPAEELVVGQQGFGLRVKPARR